MRSRVVTPSYAGYVSVWLGRSCGQYAVVERRRETAIYTGSRGLVMTSRDRAPFDLHAPNVLVMDHSLVPRDATLRIPPQ